MARAAANRAAIERWEDEGGALAIEEPLNADPGEPLDSDVEDAPQAEAR